MHQFPEFHKQAFIGSKLINKSQNYVLFPDNPIVPGDFFITLSQQTLKRGRET
jgi:hypothetical protein